MKNTRVASAGAAVEETLDKCGSVCSSASAFLKYFFICFRLCWVFVAVLGLPVVATSGGCSLGVVHGFSVQGLLLQSMGSRVLGLQ